MFVIVDTNVNTKNHIAKLPKSPLQEVIFELILNQEVDSNGNPTEESFDIAQGIFDSKIHKDFKHRIIKKLPPQVKIFPSIKYQYWTDLHKWPVVQFGPGILTVNDTDENYEWDKFYPLIIDNINRLEESYPKTLDIQKLSLRYVDAIELNEASSEQKLSFINSNFKLKLINDFTIENSQMLGLNINQTFQLNDSSLVNFSVTDGKSKRNKPAVVWQTQISTTKVKGLDDIAIWLESSHKVVSQLFKDTLTPEFYECFK